MRSFENNVSIKFQLCAASKNTFIFIYSICFFVFFLLFYFSGDVVTMECVEKLIKKDMIHPLTNSKLKEKDIIVLQRVSHEILNSPFV